MNEPSVFDRPELTLPKEALYKGFLNLNSYRHYNDHGLPIENREIHNIYGALMQQATYFGLYVRDAPSYNHRPFLLSRSFFGGS